MNEQEGLDVKCVACRRIYFSTTEQYDPGEKPNGAMLRLKNPWRRLKWSPFGDGLSHAQACRKSRKWHTMTCPGCGGYLCGGKPRLLVMPRPKDNSPVVETYSDEELAREWEERSKHDDPGSIEDKIVSMKDNEGLTFKAIAEQLGMPKGTVYDAYKRGVKG